MQGGPFRKTRKDIGRLAFALRLFGTYIAGGVCYGFFRMAVVFGALVLVLIAPALAAAGPITNLADLRALPVEEAEKGVPVRIEGTVVGLEPTIHYHFFLHDGKNGCFIKARSSSAPLAPVPGLRVLVEGLSDPMGYYPSVRDARVKVLGKADIPEPVTPDAGQMFSPQLDSQWVEVPAVVTGFEFGDARVTLTVEVHGLPFKAELPMMDDAEKKAADLMQRPARLRGIMGTIFNRQRQMTDRHFFVPSFESITPTSPLADGENSPLLSVAQLLTGSLGPMTLVRLHGTITQQDSKGFYLRDSSGSTLIQAAVSEHDVPGATVEVEGFGAVAPFRPVLRATRVRNLHAPVSISPVPLDLGKSDLSALHSEWITVDADFMGSRDGPVEAVLQFGSGGRFFEGMLPNHRGNARNFPNPGDRVRLTGICQLTTTHALPRLPWVDGIRIHLPPTGGIEILQRAPWWTAQRLLGALGLMSGVAAIGVLASWLLRRRVKRQMDIISAKLRTEAVGEERDRMARELHDTLEQQLSGVALQLDRLDDVFKQNPASAATVLSLARRMLRYTRVEARRSVWDLRSKVLEKEGLAAALRAICESSGGTPGPRIDVHVTGIGRSLPAMVEFHLLRIAQEAVTNAVKHASARSIRIDLGYSADKVELSVSDDGCGFDPAAAGPGDGPRFGLLGMRERTAKIDADLVVTSAAGEGCSVRVSVDTQVKDKADE